MRPWALPVALAACTATLSPDVPPPDHDPSAAWEATLAEVVDAGGYVDYDRLATRREALDTYVAWLGTGRVPVQADDRLAHFVNAYDALVLWLVLEEGRPASVWDVPPTGAWLGGAEGAGFFQQRQFPFGAERLSLARIENERVRFPAQDIRLHAALCRGSMSSPPLRAELYDGARLDAQLDDQMRRWVNDPARGVRVEGGEAVLSPIFEEYARDFDAWTVGDDPCTTAAAWAEPALADDLRALAARGCPHRFRPRDRRLNHRPRSEPPER